MSGFDVLGRELESAAKRGTAARWSRRAGNAGSAVAVAVALATVAVIVVGAVALLHGRRAPTPAASSAQPASGAQGAAWARALSCRRPVSPLLTLNRPPAMSDRSPDPRLLAALGALRRPWTPADAAPSGTCRLSLPPFPARAINVRYIRYVGPGLRGGKVFLVPVTGGALPPIPVHLPGSDRARLSALAHEPYACLITLGGSAGTPPFGACTPLPVIEQPAGFAMGAVVFHAVPGAVVRRLCSHLPWPPHVKDLATPRARCLASLLHQHIPAPQPQVVTGVVRDGIATVDVYRLAPRAGKPLLAGVAVHENVFSFLGSGAVAGPLKLVFKDASGRVVKSTAVGGASVASIQIGAISGYAPAPSVGKIPLLGDGFFRPPSHVRTGTVTSLPRPVPPPVAGAIPAPAPPRSSASPRTAAPRHR